MDLLQKLEILADAGEVRRLVRLVRHRQTIFARREDRRRVNRGNGDLPRLRPRTAAAISLLKILLTNSCVYDCLYCINRRSSNVQRARFTPEEVVTLTLGFYRRNCIEGLFLSSGIIRSPDYTMEQVVRVAKLLREEHGFRGYIHLKTIPDAAPEFAAEAGRYADRLSINVELPTENSLERLAPEKDMAGIRRSMGRIRLRIDEAKAERKGPRFAPAGQSTQLIIGADASSDRDILDLSTNLYGNYGLRRVYFSAFSPIPDASAVLPPAKAPLLREHRLYQADWLMRFYEFDAKELALDATGNMDLSMDPKLAWALQHREQFPMDVNLATREQLLRVPGMGVKSVDRIIQARRHRRLRMDDLARLRLPLGKIAPFIVTADPPARHPARRCPPATAPRPQTGPGRPIRVIVLRSSSPGLTKGPSPSSPPVPQRGPTDQVRG